MTIIDFLFQPGPWVDPPARKNAATLEWSASPVGQAGPAGRCALECKGIVSRDNLTDFNHRVEPGKFEQ